MVITGSEISLIKLNRRPLRDRAQRFKPQHHYELAKRRVILLESDPPICPIPPIAISKRARRYNNQEDFTLFISVMCLKTGTKSSIRSDMVSIQQSGLSEIYSRQGE